jgi:hypothetical protein
MKLRTILTEIDLDAFKAQLAKARDEVDADRVEKKDSFSDIAYAFGDDIRTFDTMINMLQDKAAKVPQKHRDTDRDEDDTPLSQSMKKHGLLTDRGGVTSLAYNYLKWVASSNMSIPTADDFPKRYKQTTIDRVAEAEKMGNFPPNVVSALRQFDNKSTIQRREDGIRTRPNLGDARNKMLQKIESLLPKLQRRIEDRDRSR